MRRTALCVLAIACVAPIVLAQSKGATYITDEEVKKVNQQPGTDRTIRVVDIGPENFAVGVIHRGASGAARGTGAGAGGGAAAGSAGRGAGAGGGAAGGGAGRGAGGGATQGEPCGEQTTSPPMGATPGMTA